MVIIEASLLSQDNYPILTIDKCQYKINNMTYSLYVYINKNKYNDIF